MFHDVTFVARGATPARAELERLLAQRGWQVGGERASFYDPATGVYFGATWARPGTPGAGELPLALEVPVLRPDPVGRQAAAEILALSRAFDLGLTGDPCAPAAELFLERWRAHNAEVHLGAVDGDVPLRALPAARNLAIWSWNRARDAYFDRLSSVETTACCPAPVRLVALHPEDATVLTAVTWVEAAPIALPDVDLVLAVGEGDSVTRVIPMVALQPLLERFPRREADHRFGRSGVVYEVGLAHWIVDYDLPPDDLVEALRALGTHRRLVPVGPDTVLDRELLDAGRPNRTTPRFAPERSGTPRAPVLR